jgi:hypothetical protein
VFRSAIGLQKVQYNGMEELVEALTKIGLLAVNK